MMNHEYQELVFVPAVVLIDSLLLLTIFVFTLVVTLAKSRFSITISLPHLAQAQ